ncbi:MAG: DUF393 domain-containing protein [Sulfitobacter sp.]|nr:DUF393 domain-containing protein [Sulfitobacter sp.]
MSEQTEVLYNGSCPICSREVNHYARLTQEAQIDVRYDDISDPGALERWGIHREEAAKRFHVRRNGQIYAGLPAFIQLWSDIPRMRWLARVVSLPGIHWLATRAYDHLAAPALYALHKRRQRRS